MTAERKAELQQRASEILLAYENCQVESIREEIRKAYDALKAELVATAAEVSR